MHMYYHVIDAYVLPRDVLPRVSLLPLLWRSIAQLLQFNLALALDPHVCRALGLFGGTSKPWSPSDPDLRAHPARSREDMERKKVCDIL